MADRSENLSEELENIKEKIFSDFAEAVKTPKEMARLSGSWQIPLRMS